jgi:hypothetical protein
VTRFGIAALIGASLSIPLLLPFAGASARTSAVRTSIVTVGPFA